MGKKISFSPHAAAIIAIGCLCLSGYVSSPAALVLGAMFALLAGNPFEKRTKLASKLLLGIAVAGLGAGIDLGVVANVGVQGIGYTAIGVTLTIGLGFLLARAMKAEKESATLISVGTAICGGSAIAAIAPVIKAKDGAVAVALGTVFTLNAVALLIFPALGHWLGLTQHQFGLWAALAIHDTSSVVGASLQYGAEALQTGTTVKLARALWIFPLCLAFGYFHAGKSGGAKGKLPWFIPAFIILSAIFSFFPALQGAGGVIVLAAKKLLVLVLFLIGANLTRETLKASGKQSLLLGVLLWVAVAVGSLLAIKSGLIG